jgi:hypothetical protein
LSLSLVQYLFYVITKQVLLLKAGLFDNISASYNLSIMPILKKFLLSFVLSLLLVTPALAQQSVLPQANATTDCNQILNDFEAQGGLSHCSGDTCSFINKDDLLGCGIKTGRISLIMLPYYATYFANYLLSLVGIVSVLFILLGGYFYIWGGITDAKEKGKKYITHALTGLGIASIAWIVVNAVMAIVTS